MNTKQWMQTHIPSLAGKTVAISGATGGIGQALCFLLAEKEARLILLDRNRDKSAALQRRLKEKFPALSVSGISLDLEDMNTVRAAARELAEMPLDYLILNAGAYYIPRHTCETGYNNLFQINFISPYYLAKKLMPSIKARGGRIVAVGSIAHNYSVIDPSDVDFSQRKQASKVYGNAKRHLMFSLFELFDNSEGLAIAHPGITLTGITAHYPKLVYALIKYPMKVIFMKPKKACLSILYGLFENCEKNQWIGPRFFNIWGLPKKQKLKSCSQEEAKAIFLTAEEIYQKIDASR